MSDFDAVRTYRALEKAADACREAWETTGERSALDNEETVRQEMDRVRRHIMDNGGFR